ncbi:hypothetical protein NDI39_08115 [Microcoleus sp. ZQ-A2]|nr:hypothetical protein [Microcoleus sp. FACHB-1]
MKGLAGFQLQTIRSVHPKNAGKIFQTLLAITFCRLDFRVKNHLSQGVDIDIWNHPSLSNFSIEVKSTTTDTVWLYQKDFQDWEKKLAEGYKIAFAVLRLDVTADWAIAPAQRIRAGKNFVLIMQAFAIRELQTAVTEEYPNVVATYAEEIYLKPSSEVLTYLAHCLEKEQKKRRKLKNIQMKRLVSRAKSSY